MWTWHILLFYSPTTNGIFEAMVLEITVIVTIRVIRWVLDILP